MSKFPQTILGLLFTSLLATAGSAWAQDPLDEAITQCTGPAGDPEPGTAEFMARDLQNMFCTEQRNLDYLQHPSNAVRGPDLYGGDPYREPSRHADRRFQYLEFDIEGLSTDHNPNPGELTAEVFYPCAAESGCDMPEGLSSIEPPYPVVIVMHGFLGDKNHEWWASQPLAENGYFVLAVNGTGDAKGSIPLAALDWIFGRVGVDNHPELRALMDTSRIGVVGHSLGAENATAMQGNPEVSAIVGWDNCNSADGCVDSDGSRLHDKGAEAQTPTLFITADYSNFPGYPSPRDSVPDELRLTGFDVLHENAVDSMLLTIRATTHLDWAGTFTFGNRLNEATSAYFTMAWFDRYLKGKLITKQGRDRADGLALSVDGRNNAEERSYRQQLAEDAFARLTATQFDDSIDRHNISQGFWDTQQAALSGDPVYGGNVPYSIAGTPVADRLSFYYRSVCNIGLPDYFPDDGVDQGRRVDTGSSGSMRARGGCTD